MLLHTADAGAAPGIRDVHHVHAADGHRPGFRVIKSQQQLEDCALSGTRPAHQRHLLALLDGHGKIVQDVLFAVTEGHMREHHITPGRGLPLFGNGAFRLVKEGVDTLHARHRRLDGLYLHAKALDGRKDAGNVVDDGHRGADRHPKQGQDGRIAGGREEHDDADHGGIQHQHDGRIDRVVKIRPLHRGIAFADAPVIAVLHVVFQTQSPDGADIVQCFRDLAGHNGDRPAVIQLSCQHPRLHMAGEHGEQRQHKQQNQRKAGVFHGDDRHDGEDAAGVRHHADDAGGEQRFHCIHIAREARGHLAGVLPHQRAGGKLGQLPGHFRAQGVGHFLAEEYQQTLLRRGEYPFQRQTAEIKKHRKECQRKPGHQPVDDAGQQQRRHQRRRHRCRRTQDGPRCEKAVGHGGHPDGLKHTIFTPVLHAVSLLSGFRTADGRPGPMPSAPHGCRRWSFRRP